jgi:hypothetical protein
MTKWFERARREISEKPNRGTAVTAERFSNVSIGSIPRGPFSKIIDQGDIVAVLICSHVLEDEIWFALQDDWHPDGGDTRAVFYADELPFLTTKDTKTPREIHKRKLTFGPGSRVSQ